MKKVHIKDVLKSLNHILFGDILTNSELIRYDLNSDRKFDWEDWIAMVKLWIRNLEVDQIIGTEGDFFKRYFQQQIRKVRIRENNGIEEGTTYTYTHKIQESEFLDIQTELDKFIKTEIGPRVLNNSNKPITIKGINRKYKKKLESFGFILD